MPSKKPVSNTFSVRGSSINPLHVLEITGVEANGVPLVTFSWKIVFLGGTTKVVESTLNIPDNVYKKMDLQSYEGLKKKDTFLGSPKATAKLVKAAKRWVDDHPAAQKALAEREKAVEAWQKALAAAITLQIAAA
ncbi:MAG: hypothetical protein GC129_06945 [Proteobacteria bacterium]|nr:hypothetical protein [Pseudomonadota bacterium]